MKRLLTSLFLPGPLFFLACLWCCSPLTAAGMKSEACAALVGIKGQLSVNEVKRRECGWNIPIPYAVLIDELATLKDAPPLKLNVSGVSPQSKTISIYAIDVASGQEWIITRLIRLQNLPVRAKVSRTSSERRFVQHRKIIIIYPREFLCVNIKYGLYADTQGVITARLVGIAENSGLFSAIYA